MFVTGGPPVRSGRGIPQRMIVRSRAPSALVAKFSVYHSKECSDGGLGCSTDGIPRAGLILGEGIMDWRHTCAILRTMLLGGAVGLAVAS
jgi:hypothetical protein